MQIIKIKCGHSFCTNMFRSPRTKKIKKKKKKDSFHVTISIKEKE